MQVEFEMQMKLKGVEEEKITKKRRQQRKSKRQKIKSS